LRVRLNQPTIRCVTADEQAAEFVSDLLTEIPRTAVVPAVRAALGVPEKVAKQIVQAFDDYVARPFEANLKNLHGRDLGKRNPMIYTTRGIDSAEEWVERVLADKETSAIEGHIGGAQQPRGGRPALPQPQVRRCDLDRVLPDHREERLQVKGHRPQRVRPAPACHELQIPVHQPIAQPVTDLARPRHETRKTREAAHFSTIPACDTRTLERHGSPVY
jgi:hypothetical protein